MALIYTDSDLVEQGYLSGTSMDWEEEESENSFALEMGLDNCDKLSKGCFVFDENNTKFGGRVQKVKIHTSNKSLVWEGMTFSGILATKVIEPPENDAYRIIIGTLYDKVDAVLGLVGLSNVFYVEDSGITSSSWQIDRYTNVLKAFRKLADKDGLTLVISYERNHEGPKLRIGFLPKREVHAGEEYDSDIFSFEIEQDMMPVNHLYCLGSGQLTSREVYHIYRIGNEYYRRYKNNQNVYRISDGARIDGFLDNWSIENEIADVYDYSNVESNEELLKSGLEHFKEILDNSTKLEISPPDDLSFRIGDIIAGYEQKSGIYVEKQIKKIIYKIHDNSLPSVTYETDNTKRR